MISLMGCLKIFSTSIKYFPQLLWNYQRKSTEGWSIFNVLMDLIGGVFSVIQTLLLYNYSINNKLNVIKFLLGALTIVYDLCFIMQHYWLYPSCKHLEFMEEIVQEEQFHEPREFNESIENIEGFKLSSLSEERVERVK